MSPPQPPSETDETARSGAFERPSTPGGGRTRRSILRTTGATAAGVLGAQLIGSASGATPEFDRIETSGNQLVDESGTPVQFHGVSLIDPLRAQREWRGKTIDEMFAMATSEEWPHTLVRVPCQPQDIAAARNRGPSNTLTESLIPHGDNWGPIKPGTFTETDLRHYCEWHLDPLVEAARERGVALLLDYHREYPVFYQRYYAEKPHRGIDFWQGDNAYDAVWCSETSDADWDWDEGMCGHRGVLWHGPDQIEEIKNLSDNQNKLNDPDTADPWFDPWCGADGGEDLLGAELEMFWSHVADRYGGDSDSHVLFELFNEPTAPHQNDWGSPGAMPDLYDGYGIVVDIANEEVSLPYWELFLKRATPWLNTIAENAPGRLVAVGGPHWSQYTHWAQERTVNGVGETESVTGVDAAASNIAYTAHAFTQEQLRPLSRYFGDPAAVVPVLFTEFGWESGGGPDWEPRLAGTTAVWGDGDEDAIEEWGRPEGAPPPADLSDAEKEKLNYFGMGGEEFPPKDEYVGFEAFFENHPVHPVAGYFDHTWVPRFFSDRSVSDGNWELNPREDTPGRWWHEYLQAHTDRSVGPSWATDIDGDGRYEDLNGNDRVDFADVNTLFQKTGSDDVRDHVVAFDFTGDGEIDLQDVLALFETI